MSEGEDYDEDEDEEGYHAKTNPSHRAGNSIKKTHAAAAGAGGTGTGMASVVRAKVVVSSKDLKEPVGNEDILKVPQVSYHLLE